MDFENANEKFDKRLCLLINDTFEKIESAMPESDVDRCMGEQAALQEDYREGKISHEDFQRQCSEIDKKIGVVKFHSITDMIACMRTVGISENGINEIAADENARMNEINKNADAGIVAEYE